MAQHNANDPRTNSQKQEMAEHFVVSEAEYRDADWCSIVYEDDDVVLIADHKGYEFAEWNGEYGEDFSQTMHDLADQLVDRSWASDYPLVYDKFED